jgi:hypothetical protein
MSAGTPLGAPFPPVAVGDRVRITRTLVNPSPLPAGMTGTVEWVDNRRQDHQRRIAVRWADGRCIMLLPGDPFRLVID